jgi:subtilase family serine protease
MDADPRTGAEVYVNGTPETVGGTSLSSPLALGAWAVIESAAGNRFGFAAPGLYRLYPGAQWCAAGIVSAPPGQLGTSAADPSYPFHDVYLGSNVAYPNTFGWDYVTGLGTYDVAKVLAALRR